MWKFPEYDEKYSFLFSPQHKVPGWEFVKKYWHKCPLGVKGRNSDNRLYQEKMGWTVSQPLKTGLEKTYQWIYKQVNKN